MITLVFGRRAGLYAAQAAKAAGEVRLDADAVEVSRDRAARVAAGLGDDGLKALRTAIASTMSESAWVIKDEARLRRGLEQIRELAEGERQRTAGSLAKGGPADGFAWNKALEVPNLLLCAELLLMGAIERKESRGAFFRADYPKTDNERWLKNITHKQVDGRTVMDTVPVDLPYCAPES
jgi:succinate dehydrogenase / fumarate reductase flavoprotein subunit